MVEFQCKYKPCWFNEVYNDDLAPSKCPECGSRNYRLGFIKEPRKKVPIVGADATSRNPRWSWAMGCNVNEIPKMMKQYPDREYNPVNGQLLVKSRQHKKQLMREHNMYEMS